MLRLPLAAEGGDGVIIIPNSDDFSFAIRPKSSSTIDEAEVASNFFSDSVDDNAWSIAMLVAFDLGHAVGSDEFDDRRQDLGMFDVHAMHVGRFNAFHRNLLTPGRHWIGGKKVGKVVLA